MNKKANKKKKSDSGNIVKCLNPNSTMPNNIDEQHNLFFKSKFTINP